MKKIISLFKRDYKGNRLVYDEVVSGAEWVIEGKGVATIKFDGTACMVRDGKLYKRYDRKLKKRVWRRKKKGHKGPWQESDFKPAPEGWEGCEPEPNQHTGHWPGWVPVGDGPDDKWHRKAWDNHDRSLPDGTYELLGTKIQGDPYYLGYHALWPHSVPCKGEFAGSEPPRDFNGLRAWFEHNEDGKRIEGIVWHHPDGRMVKIKRKDFGLPWPLSKDELIQKECLTDA